ncbi:type I restriction endonuclease subunit R, partial [Pseudoalteromonas sp. SIMBA_153]
SEVEELTVLKDNNLLSIKQSPEFAKNKSPLTPTNRICTSLIQRSRLSFILQYALTYVKERKGLQKHVMRYPQIFATKAIENKLNEGVKKPLAVGYRNAIVAALKLINVYRQSDGFRIIALSPYYLHVGQ